jgi:hypothetical protein
MTNPTTITIKDGNGASQTVSTMDALLALAESAYPSPNGNRVATSTTLDSLFSDDFGGNAVNTTSGWDVLDGGLGANANLGFGALTQAAIGTGTIGMTDSVAGSGLTVSMGTVSGAERWYLSKQAFAGKEDILVLLSKSQPIAANSIFIGLVEVDPVTLVPLLNPNFAGEFTNRGGCEFGLSTGVASFQAEAIGDSSAAKAIGGIGAAGAVLTTTQEFLIEIDSRDVIVSNSAVDSTAAKNVGASRVSTQVPNDRKLYKLLMRFRNVAVATATSIVIQRVLVIDNYEQRVQVSTGEGDQIGAKSLGVNVLNAPTVIPAVTSAANSGVTLNHKLISAANTNPTLVVAGTHRLLGGSVSNMSAAVKFLKFYNKVTAPTVGTDTPMQTIALQPNTTYSLMELMSCAVGALFGVGIGYGITGLAADSDTTAVAAGDVIINILYI